MSITTARDGLVSALRNARARLLEHGVRHADIVVTDGAAVAGEEATCVVRVLGHQVYQVTLHLTPTPMITDLWDVDALVAIGAGEWARIIDGARARFAARSN